MPPSCTNDTKHGVNDAGGHDCIFADHQLVPALVCYLDSKPGCGMSAHSGVSHWTRKTYRTGVVRSHAYFLVFRISDLLLQFYWFFLHAHTTHTYRLANAGLFCDIYTSGPGVSRLSCTKTASKLTKCSRRGIFHLLLACCRIKTHLSSAILATNPARQQKQVLHALSKLSDHQSTKRKILPGVRQSSCRLPKLWDGKPSSS